MQSFSFSKFFAMAALGLVTPFGNCGCPTNLAGATYDWATAICILRTGVIVDSPKLRTCVDKLAARDKFSGAPYQNCMLNERYKAEWCAIAVKEGFEKSISECVRSNTSGPEGVMHAND
jgi:hypothetical protein